MSSYMIQGVTPNRLIDQAAGSPSPQGEQVDTATADGRIGVSESFAAGIGNSCRHRLNLLKSFARATFQSKPSMSIDAFLEAISDPQTEGLSELLAQVRNKMDAHFSQLEKCVPASLFHGVTAKDLEHLLVVVAFSALPLHPRLGETIEEIETGLEKAFSRGLGIRRMERNSAG